MSLNIIFMGTPDFSVPTLAALVAAGHRVIAVYSQPPRPAGRGMDLRLSPVHAYAAEHAIPVLTPVSLRQPAAVDAFRAHGADVAVVVAYGLILPQAILDLPTHGCLNLHASALPRWRGAAPIQRAVMAGDRETAVMVMQMEAGLDTGPVCLSDHVPIGENSTTGEMHDTLASRGADLMVRALAALERGTLVCTPQSVEGVTYARKIEKAEAHIDFARPAAEVHALIRGLSPFPGAWFEIGDGRAGERVKVLRASLAATEGSVGEPGEVLDGALSVACGQGAVRFVELQRAGKKPMMAADLQRGFRIEPGTRLR